MLSRNDSHILPSPSVSVASFQEQTFIAFLEPTAWKCPSKTPSFGRLSACIGDKIGFHILARRRRQYQTDHASRLHRGIVPHPARRRRDHPTLPRYPARGARGIHPYHTALRTTDRQARRS